MNAFYKIYFKGAVDVPFGTARTAGNFTVVTVEKLTSKIKKEAKKHGFVDIWKCTPTTESLYCRG